MSYQKTKGDELGKKLHALSMKDNRFIVEGLSYQGLAGSGLVGQRPTEERFDIYGLRNTLESRFKVLDIGCNIGIFSLYTAGFVSEVHGVECSPILCEAAEEAKEFMGVENCFFFNTTIEDYKPTHGYDMVYAFAVANYIGLDGCAYAKKLKSLVVDNGYLLYETHEIGRGKYRYEKDEQVKEFVSASMDVVREGFIRDDGKRLRRYTLFKKHK